MSDTARILVADDQRDVVSALKLLFKGAGYETTGVSSPEAALAALREQVFDALLIDLNYSRDTTSGREGLDLIHRVREFDADLPIVVMTAWSSVPVAVEAMQLGAGDFIEKPWDNQRMLSILRNQVRLGRALRRGNRLSAAAAQSNQDEPFVAGAPAMREVLALLDRVAPSAANVLITGEHGTGKSLLARLIHARSDRTGQPLVTVNMGGVAESVFESEMFGHVKGAFTDAARDRVGRFEMADNGTLFLDEIANIPPAQQAKLLRVLEEGEFERVGSSRTRRVDVRVISATNADLETAASEGRFRQDLLFRLNTVQIRVPALRDRRDDITPLAGQFLARAAARYQRSDLALSDATLTALRQHSWPGNVRELSHVMERAVLMAPGATIEPSDLGLRATSLPTPVSDPLAGLSLEDAERRMIEASLVRHDNNVQDTARELGLSRSALYRRLEKFGIRAADGGGQD